MSLQRDLDHAAVTVAALALAARLLPAAEAAIAAARSFLDGTEHARVANSEASASGEAAAAAGGVPGCHSGAG
ncbi:hypothetical protein K1W54_12475 [Micromonospora sp. CPCC 205371]|nr:hypothetical protein [Micromonospora sp. CPCC 205371]